MLVAVVDGGDGDTLDLLCGEREGAMSGPCEKRDDAYRHSPGFGFVISPPILNKNDSISLNLAPQFSVSSNRETLCVGSQIDASLQNTLACPVQPKARLQSGLFKIQDQMTLRFTAVSERG